MARAKADGKIRHAVPMGKLLAALLVVLLVLQTVFTLTAAPDEDKLYVYVLDVGQSDAILLCCGGRTVLIDTGTATAQEQLRAALLRYGVQRLDWLVLTHLHEDHIGNARYLLTHYEVGRVLLPLAASEEPVATLLLASLAQMQTPTVRASTDTAISLGDALCRVLYAPTESGAGTLDENNQSIVLRVTLGENVLLLMGDGEETLEQHLLSYVDHDLLRCDFLKVGHHGAAASSSAAFLAVASPRYAAISCGRYNSYGFPHADTLRRLQEAGATVYRTDEQGTLGFMCDGEEIVYFKEGGLAYE